MTWSYIGPGISGLSRQLVSHQLMAVVSQERFHYTDSDLESSLFHKYSVTVYPMTNWVSVLPARNIGKVPT